MSAVLDALQAAGLTVGAFAIGLVLVIRFAAMDPRRWHVEPGLWQKQPMGNDYMRGFGAALDGADGIAGLCHGDAASLALDLQMTALAEPRTTLLAGDALLGYITLVQRSKWMGYPDAITIWAQDYGPDQATVSIWSRSRYGNKDFGVNRTRVGRWLAANRMILADPSASS
jgi:Protein of unknown function (DUF1499)